MLVLRLLHNIHSWQHNYFGKVSDGTWPLTNAPVQKTPLAQLYQQNQAFFRLL